MPSHAAPQVEACFGFYSRPVTQSGNDVLIGGAGNDVLVAGTGRNLLIGGAGAD